MRDDKVVFEEGMYGMGRGAGGVVRGCREEGKKRVTFPKPEVR